MKKIEEELFELQDLEYKDFIASLTPNKEKDTFIGVRVPVLRQIAKNMSKEDAEEFMKELPHKYYEENLLHGYIIQKDKDYDHCINELNKFLPYVDAWAVSDTMVPKIFAKQRGMLLPIIKQWLTSNHTFEVRFAILSLMNYYLDDEYINESIELVKNIYRDEYYIKIMQAWFFQTALVKQWDITIKVIENKELDKWIHNKTIQKSVESYRISSDQKDYLKKLKQ